MFLVAVVLPKHKKYLVFNAQNFLENNKHLLFIILGAYTGADLGMCRP